MLEAGPWWWQNLPSQDKVPRECRKSSSSTYHFSNSTSLGSSKSYVTHLQRPAQWNLNKNSHIFYFPQIKAMICSSYHLTHTHTHTHIHAHSYPSGLSDSVYLNVLFRGIFILVQDVMKLSKTFLRCVVCQFVNMGSSQDWHPEQKVPVTQSDGRTRKLCPLNDLEIRSVLRGSLTHSSLWIKHLTSQ